MAVICGSIVSLVYVTIYYSFLYGMKNYDSLERPFKGAEGLSIQD